MVYSAATLVIFVFASCSDCASGTTTIALPNFSFQTLVNDGVNLDLNEFRNHLDHATENHLFKLIKNTLTIDLGGSTGGFQGLHLESTVRRRHDRFVTEPRAIIQTSFEGKALFSDANFNTQIMNEEILHLVVAQALIGDAYWKLMHQLVEDPVLKNVDSLDVIIDDTILQDEREDQNFKTEDDKKESGAIAVLATFSTIMLLSTMYISFIAYRRYKSQASSCSHSSKSSDSTGRDDDYDFRVEEDFDDEEIPKVTSTAPPRGKKQRAMPYEKIITEAPSLGSILEEGEDEEELSIASSSSNLILI